MKLKRGEWRENQPEILDDIQKRLFLDKLIETKDRKDVFHGLEIALALLGYEVIKDDKT